MSSERLIEGIAIKYHDKAKLPWGNEIIRENAFGDVGRLDVILNQQHDRNLLLCRTGGGGLVLKDGEGKLSFKAELPDTQNGIDVYKLIKKRVLLGASLEFRAKKDSYMEDGTRIIESGELVGIAIVDRPAYPQSLVEAREKVLKNINKNKNQKRFWN